MRASLVGVVAVALCVRSTAAQTLEITPYTFHGYAPGKQFEVTRPISTPTGFQTRGYLGYQRSSTGMGARVGVWPLRRLGLELSVATRSGLRSVLERIPNDPTWYGQGWKATVTETGLRVAVRPVSRPGGRLQFAAGVTRLTFGGPAYYEAADQTPLVNRTVTGGSFGASWMTRVSGWLMASVGIDDIVYRVTPTTLPGDTIRRWTQHDIALSTAFVVRVN
jgi:hypothetical protein